ncbi:MAG: class I SAM-dependent methyltransferase, partial [Alphaproteobacteria bacterium]|nr:class I SAM-dependent methyltransferase [Alphaproteobacteria bacterium]
LKRLNTEGQLTTVDISDVNHPEHGPWRKVGMSRSPSAFAETLGLSDYIDFRVQPCQEYMRQTDKKFDLIFLDGDHSVCAVYNEISVALPLLRENGVILLHDYYKDGKAMYPDGERIGGPFYAVQRIVRENPRINILPLGALPWPTKQGTSVTSLAVVAKS